MTTMGIPDALRPKLDELQRRGLVVGGVGLAVTLPLALIWPGAVLPSYLVAYLYFVGIALGSVSFQMLHNLTGGAWGAAIRRPLEAAGLTLIPLVLLFLPIVLGAGSLYPWVHPDDHLKAEIAHKLGYLSLGRFVLFAALYFVVWIGLAVSLASLSAAQDRTDNPWPTTWMKRISGPGLPLMFLLASLAAVDWGMSLEPAWASTIYPPLIIVGWGLTTFAVMIVIVVLLSPYEPVPEVVTPGQLHDLGNLMLAFVMLWAYMSFSQYLIIWSGQLAEEQPWYLRRSFGPWRFVAQLLILFHFVVPFLILLFRESKRRAPLLMGVAGVVAAMHVIDLAWMVLPAQNANPLDPAFTWGSALVLPFAVAGVGGIWLASFLWFLKRRDLLPAHLPGLVPVPEPTPSGGP